MELHLDFKHKLAIMLHARLPPKIKPRNSVVTIGGILSLKMLKKHQLISRGNFAKFWSAAVIHPTIKTGVMNMLKAFLLITLSLQI